MCNEFNPRLTGEQRKSEIIMTFKKSLTSPTLVLHEWLFKVSAVPAYDVTEVKCVVSLHQ